MLPTLRVPLTSGSVEFSGGVGALPTRICTVAGADVAPWLSRTVSDAVNVPAVEYTWVTVALVVSAGLVPSPKSQM